MTINEPKIIVISDTHFGSKYENFKYIDYVYNYAKKHNIQNIFHAGDLLQSTMRNVKQSLVEPHQQILYIIKNYPFDENITNNILIGNHDYHTYQKDLSSFELFVHRDDFNFIGTKYKIIHWQNQIISLYHPISKYQINIPNLEELIRICGHHHQFQMIKPNLLRAPTLSDDLKFPSFPGFLVLTTNDSFLYVELIEFKDSQIENKIVLEKKFKS